MTLPAEFSTDLDTDTSLLVLRGEVDEGACILLRQEIGEATAGLTKPLRIDLTEVTFLPSAAVGVLATSRATAAKNGADIELVAQEGTIAQRVLTICGLPHVTP